MKSQPPALHCLLEYTAMSYDELKFCNITGRNCITWYKVVPYLKQVYGSGADPGPWQLLPQLPSVTAHWLAPNYTAWWQRHMCANNLSRIALGSAVAGIQTCDLLIASPAPDPVGPGATHGMWLKSPSHWPCPQCNIMHFTWSAVSLVR